MPSIILESGEFLLYLLSIIRVIAIVLSLLMLIFIIVFLIFTKWINYRFLESTVEFLRGSPYGSKKFLRQWKNITKRLKTSNEYEYKLAVIEADNLLEKSLKEMKFKGLTTREKIKQIPKTILENTEDLEKAHNVRDNIVHDPDYQISLEEAKKTLNIYEKALKQLFLS